MKTLSGWMLPAFCAIAVTCIALGQSAAISKLPRFPLPRDFVDTPADLKAVSGNGGLMKAIQLKFDCKKCDGAKEPGVRIGGAPVDLGALGKGAIVTAFTDADCDAAGNCAIYIFYAKDGGYVSERLGQGTQYTVVKGTNPVPGIATRSRTGAKTETVQRSEYNGTAFARTGCDALYDRNDMGDVDVSACP